MNNILLVLSLTFILSSCLPVIFTGTAATAVTLSGDRTLGTVIDDNKLATKIKSHLAKDGFRSLYAKLSVSVIAGRVLYTGSVSKEDDVLKAIDIAWSYPETQEVACEATVDRDSDTFDLARYTRDSMITAQIKSKAFLDRSIKLSNYTVITVNSAVYLFGTARNAEEIEKLSHIASRIRGVNKVVSHVKVQGEPNLSITN
jgi:osmotically-inducible protein OsmY